MINIEITSVAFTRGSRSDVQTGLLGYVTCVLNDALVLGGVTLRQTAAGKLTLSFPTRKDGRGHKHSILRPVDDDALLVG